MTAGRALGIKVIAAGQGRPVGHVVRNVQSVQPPCTLRDPRRDTAAFYTVAILHVAALAIMATSEVDLVAKAAYLLVWGLLNFLWLALLRRPVAPALISLAFIVALILISQFKHDKLWMTVDFVDLMILTRTHSHFFWRRFRRSGCRSQPPPWVRSRSRWWRGGLTLSACAFAQV